MINLRPCQLFQLKADEVIWRVLWMDVAADSFYAMSIDGKTGMPKAFQYSSVQMSSVENELITEIEDPWTSFRNPKGELLERHISVRDKGWKLIAPLIAEQPQIYDEKLRGAAIRARESETGQPRNLIYKCLRRYWQRGMTPNCLLPDYHKSGGLSVEKAIGHKPRGRPRKSDTLGLNVTPKIRQIFTTHITKTFAKRKTLSLAESYKLLVFEFFSESSIDLVTGQQVICALPTRPSLAQFRYWFEKDNNIFDVKRSRLSARVYDKDFRPILGSATAGAFGPGSRYEIDATIVDLYLVSRLSRGDIIGRPTLYVVIDVFTRMIVGIYVGLEAPSWVGAMQALHNATADKTDYCAKFGIDIDVSDWPSVGLPERILADRGELASDMIETLINTFGVHIENTAPYRADWKGIVEQRFKLLPAKFKAYSPGYIDTDFRARGGNDYRLDAVLDIDQFTRIILNCVLHYNNAHSIKGYEKLPEMIADKVPSIPIELWNWGISNRSGALKQASSDTVRKALLPSAMATVTAAGIRLFGCHFSCPLAIEENWFAKARQRGTWKVKASYDPRLMDVIYLHPEKSKHDFISCDITEKSRHYRGKTLWEITHMQALDRQQNGAVAGRKLNSEVSLIAAIDAVVKEAQGTKPDVSGLSKAARIGSIRENRKDEKDDLRRRDAFLLAPSGAEADATKVLNFPGTQQGRLGDKPSTREFLAGFEDEVDDT